MRPSNKYTHRIYIVLEDGKAKKKKKKSKQKYLTCPGMSGRSFCSSDIHVQVRRKFTQEYCFAWPHNRHKFVSMNITKRQCSSYTHTLKHSQPIIITCRKFIPKIMKKQTNTQTIYKLIWKTKQNKTKKVKGFSSIWWNLNGTCQCCQVILSQRVGYSKWWVQHMSNFA